ncbi:MAG: Protein dedA [Candidatus Moranbacteria bacterium GW2011_GWF2_36_839]|nr:MAG: Protein dedA [Candidatus Moranbacteria bacterium GW2011_GWF1_36_78]KKQ16509.1 MAG: Protein dedA [Candidatus Moranbacteria bacterium GW2011_GWF2_36_839]HAT74062.1 DedA family protein [Candidatus Moranbacteria bacterium]HBY10729.1 DedA family protein [Candidatus Moranbacteria bacterium]
MIIIDFILNIDVHLGEIIASYGRMTYAILFLIIFAETGFVFTPFLPGDSLLFAAGMFSATGSFNVIFLALLLWTAAFLGDNINYWIGYYFGQKIVNNKYVPVNQKHIDSTQEFYSRHGGKTIFLARFMPIIRTFAPFVAGIGKMHYRKFISYSILGGFTWVGLFVFAGYFFGNIPIIKDNFSIVIMGIIAISVFPGIFKLIKSKLKKSAQG